MPPLVHNLLPAPLMRETVEHVSRLGCKTQSVRLGVGVRASVGAGRQDATQPAAAAVRCTNFVPEEQPAVEVDETQVEPPSGQWGVRWGGGRGIHAEDGGRPGGRCSCVGHSRSAQWAGVGKSDVGSHGKRGEVSAYPHAFFNDCEHEAAHAPALRVVCVDVMLTERHSRCLSEDETLIRQGMHQRRWPQQGTAIR